jgi:hypothetical protein
VSSGTGWTGQGLPPMAEARLRRFAESPVRSSLLSVPAAVAIDSVGFDPVGEVMGSAVMQISWRGWGCGYFPNRPNSAAKVVGSSSRASGFAPYLQAVLRGYRSALSRLVAEAGAMNADGVVGIAWLARELGGDNHEYMAIGTAVRARSRVRPARLFTTDLDGPDFAALLIGGWVPVALEVAMEMAIRHDDAYTELHEQRRYANVEIYGHTELAQYVRAGARQKLARQLSVSGADGVVVTTLDFDIREAYPSGHKDHVAEARIFGTSIAAFRRGAQPPPAPLPMLVL